MRLVNQIGHLLTPPFGVPEFPHDDNSKRCKYILCVQFAWPGVVTFPGLPATIAPIAFTSDGLPVGAQIIGAPHNDHTTIEFATLLESDGLTVSALCKI